MGWDVLIPLIVKYGLPVAEALYKKWSSGTAPTEADFTELRSLLEVKAVDKVKEQLVKAGVPLDSPAAIALIDMAS